MTEPDTYELYAIRYATNPRRRRMQNFIINDIHDGVSPIDFFVWAAVSLTRTIVVDIGGNERVATARGHDFLRCPSVGLGQLGIAASDVQDLVITHLHWDHAGNVDLFPNARVHLQADEMAFATGPLMQRKFLRRPFEADDVCAMVRRLYDDMVVFHDGDGVVAPGVEIRHIGGHTLGLQIVRVHTRRGWVVLASDGAHYYENFERPNPFPVIMEVAKGLAGFDTMQPGRPAPTTLSQAMTRWCCIAISRPQRNSRAKSCAWIWPLWTGFDCQDSLQK